MEMTLKIQKYDDIPGGLGGGSNNQNMEDSNAPRKSHHVQKLQKMWIYNGRSRNGGLSKDTDRTLSHIFLPSQNNTASTTSSSLASRPDTPFERSKKVKLAADTCGKRPQCPQPRTSLLPERAKTLRRTNSSLAGNTYRPERRERLKAKRQSLERPKYPQRKRIELDMPSSPTSTLGSDCGSRESDSTGNSDNIECGIENSSISQPDLLKYTSGMVQEIMRYEMRLASLYGKMMAVTKENETLRSNYNSICRRLAKTLVSEAKKSSNESLHDASLESHKINDKEAVPYVGGWNKQHNEDMLGEIGDVDDTPSDENLGGKEVVPEGSPKEKDRLPNSALTKLKSLELRVLDRLQELENAVSNAEKKAMAEEKGKQCLTEESPFTKELRDKLAQAYEEIERIRALANVRVYNVRLALGREKISKQNIQKQNDELNSKLKALANFGMQTKHHFSNYQQVIDDQKQTITQLQEQLNVDQSTDVAVLQNDYKRLVAAHSLVSKVSDIQKNDINILNQQLDEEKLKNSSLMEIIERQGRQTTQFTAGNPPRSDEVQQLIQRCKDLESLRRKDLERYETHIGLMHNIYKPLQGKEAHRVGDVLADLRNSPLSVQEKSPGQSKDNGALAVKTEISEEEIEFDNAMQLGERHIQLEPMGETRNSQGIQSNSTSYPR